jgi:hypothetical protein
MGSLHSPQAALGPLWCISILFPGSPASVCQLLHNHLNVKSSPTTSTTGAPPPPAAFQLLVWRPHLQVGQAHLFSLLHLSSSVLALALPGIPAAPAARPTEYVLGSGLPLLAHLPAHCRPLHHLPAVEPPRAPAQLSCTDSQRVASLGLSPSLLCASLRDSPVPWPQHPPSSSLGLQPPFSPPP